MKNLLKLGKALSSLEQQQVNGGGKRLTGQPICLNPYLTDGTECIDGYHMHPQGHCICCQDL